MEAPKKLSEMAQTSLSTGYEIPKLEELNIDLSSLGKDLFPGGETEALKRLAKYMNQQVSYEL